MTANKIHDYMTNHPELFVDIDWKNCWNYINAGYIVYFVWKNSEGAGHIATGYPTSTGLTTILDSKIYVGDIVQAGVTDKTKIFRLKEGAPWVKEKLPSVRTFLYLGYLHF
jgi:hypothetical protein